MRQKQSKSLRNLPLLDYQYDGSSLFLFFADNPFRVVSFLPESLEPLNEFTIESPIQIISKPCIDANFIYLATKVGDILVLDKYSGDIVTTINLGALIVMSDIYQDAEYLYIIAGIPVSNGYAISHTDYCIVIIDKNSGLKHFQSQCFHALPNLITFDYHIWCLTSSELHQYSKMGNLIGIRSINFKPSYKPIVTESYTIISSNKGSLEIFNKNNLDRHHNTLIEANNSAPLYAENQLFWFTKSGLTSFNLHNKKINKFKSLQDNVVSSTAYSNGFLYGSNLSGDLIKTNINSSTEKLKLSNSPLWKPIIIENYLIITSKENIYLIEDNL